MWSRCRTVAVPSARLLSNAVAESAPGEWVEGRPYRDIPGPKPAPLVGNLWRYMPGIGTYKGLETYQIVAKQHEQYGDIFKLSGMIAADMVLLFDPDDIQKVFRNDGPWPKRNALKIIQHYAKNEGKQWFPDGYGGIFASDGVEWQKGRHIMNPILMQTKTVKMYVEPMNRAADKLIAKTEFLRTQDAKHEMPENYMDYLNKWSLESVTLIGLNQELGLLDPDESQHGEGHQFIKNVLELFDALYELDIRPSIWKYISTPTYRKFVKTMNANNKYLEEQTEAAIERTLKEGNLDEPTVLKRLLKEDRKYLLGTIKDMISAGVDTTSKTLAAILLFLARNPRVQQELRNEVMRFLPRKDSPVTSQALDQMPYLKAVIKEVLRFCPIGIGNMRQLQKDLVLSGYQVPKGTNVVAANYFLCHKERYFSQPEQFLPERWMRKDGAREVEINPWVYMPFGYGPRSCIGKRLASLELEVMTVKMVRNFKMEWHHGELRYSMKLLYGVSNPLKLQMEPLES